MSQAKSNVSTTDPISELINKQRVLEAAVEKAEAEEHDKAGDVLAEQMTACMDLMVTDTTTPSGHAVKWLYLIRDGKLLTFEEMNLCDPGGKIIFCSIANGSCV